MYYFKPAKNGFWRWTFISSNGQMAASTETFPTRSNAKRAAYKHAIASAKQVMLHPWEKSLKYLKEFKMLEWEERPGA